VSRRLLLLGLGVAVGEAAALVLAAKRWFGRSPAPEASSFDGPTVDVPNPQARAFETPPPAPAFERRVGERRSGTDRREKRVDVAEPTESATERRSGVDRRSGIDRRPVAAESSPL
jgi:hypothetical protein